MRKLIRQLPFYNILLTIYLQAVRAVERFEVFIVLPILNRVRFLRKLYFIIFSNAFSYEIKIYTLARMHYMQNKIRGNKNEFLLRRNIHRIEKGLIIPNPKKTFALGYIYETIQQYSQILKDSDSNLTSWAHDVLNKYFNKVEFNPEIKRSYDLFISVTSEKNSNYNNKPYYYNPGSPHSYDTFKQLAFYRKSVRSFQKGKIPRREDFDKAIEIAGRSPSSCNRQPFEFRIFDQKDIVTKISDLPAGAKTFADNIPSITVVVGNMMVSPSPGDRHLMYIDSSLAAMGYVYALESMGISSCIINWPENELLDIKIREIIKINEFERPIMFIATGYAETNCEVAHSERKTVAEIRKYNI